MLTTLSQGTRIMARDHGGNVEPRATGTILGKCPECTANFYEPHNTSDPDALRCCTCGHDFLLALIARNT